MSARRGLGFLGWSATVAGAAVVLVTAPVPAPPSDLPSLLEWPNDVGAVAAALGVVRVAAIAALAITLAATVLGVGARAARWARLAAACDRWTLPPVRRILDRVAAGSMVAAVVVAPGRAGAAEASPPAPVLRSLDAPPPTLRRLEATPEPPPPAVEVAPSQPPEEFVVVEPGDSFWTIADRVLSARLGRPADLAEVDDYWRTLVDANVDRLVVAGEADLIFSGQRLRLPG